MLPVFDRPLSDYMTRTVETAHPTTELATITTTLQDRRISSIPIVDNDGSLVGLVSRTDLIRFGLFYVGLRGVSPTLPIPNRTAADLMTTLSRTIAPTGSLRDAAREMVQHSIHRLFVTEGPKLVGVISTLDLTRAVADARIEAPLSEWMTSPVVTVNTSDHVSAAVDLLNQHHLTAVVVVEGEWPVGIFSQVEALAARSSPRETLVEQVADTAMICLPSSLRMFRAAAQAAQLNSRRVIVIEATRMVGILGGLDFARVVARQ